MPKPLAAGKKLPTKGTVFISVKDDDKPKIVEIATRLAEHGFEICATVGTAAYLRKSNLDVRIVKKVYEGRPHIVDFLKNGEIVLIVNTPSTKAEREDEKKIRLTALRGEYDHQSSRESVIARDADILE